MDQPECANCGMTAITYVHAFGDGWRRVFGRLLCTGCANRFPSWMR